MTWKEVAFYGDVATLSDDAAVDIAAAADDGTGDQASRHDHVHILGAATVDDSTVEVTAGVWSLKDDGITLAKLGNDLCTTNSGISQYDDESFMIDFDDDTISIVSNHLDVKDEGIGNTEINNAANDYVFANIILTPKGAGSGSTEGGLFYDSGDDHFYMYVA